VGRPAGHASRGGMGAAERPRPQTETPGAQRGPSGKGCAAGDDGWRCAGGTIPAVAIRITRAEGKGQNRPTGEIGRAEVLSAAGQAALDPVGRGALRGGRFSGGGGACFRAYADGRNWSR
jgi:hypothetical protein